jgi:hypothetical protein
MYLSYINAQANFKFKYLLASTIFVSGMKKEGVSKVM